MPPKKHERLNPSGSHRWLICGASAVDDAEDRSSEASREGDTAHDLAERILRGEPGIGFPDEEMEEGVMEYVEYVQGLPGADHGKIEVELMHPRIPEFGGTVDFLIVTSTILHVVDFKYGRKPVLAKDNKQLLSYLGIAWEQYPGRHTFLGSIVQPRVSRPQCVSFTDQEIISHLLDVERAAKDTSVVPGDHCLWCPLLLTCEANKEYNQKLAARVFDDRPTVQECLEIISAKEVIEEKADLAKRHLMKLALQGDKIPGYKVVRNLANRSWKDEEQAEKKLRAAGADEDQLFKKTMRSPAQLEKVVPKQLVAKLCKRVDRGPILAVETSKKPDYDPLSVFQD